MASRDTVYSLKNRQTEQREKLGTSWAGHPANGVQRKTPFPEGAFIRWTTDEPTDGGLYLVRFVEPGKTHPRLVAASRAGLAWTFYGGDGQLRRIPAGSSVVSVAALGALFVAEGR